MNRLLCLFALVAALAASPVNATVVFGNLGPNGDGAANGSSASIGGFGFDQFLGFNTGSSTLLELSSVSLWLESAAGGATPVELSLYSDVAGIPNLNFGGQIGPSVALPVDGKKIYTFSFSSGLVLQQNTTYWIGLSATNDTLWYAVDPEARSSEQNGSGFTIAAIDWVHYRTDGPADGWYDWGGASNSLSLAAKEPAPPGVPEHGVWTALEVLGGTALGAVLRRRRPRS